MVVKYILDDLIERYEHPKEPIDKNYTDFFEIYLQNIQKEREKTMWGLKIDTTPIIEGHRLYYNFIKPHESLDGKTPSEEAGITIEGDNKWLTLMKKAIKYQKSQWRHKLFKQITI